LVPRCAFAYGDNFVITSYHGERKPSITPLSTHPRRVRSAEIYEEDMAPTDKTGVEITVPVKSCDFNQFATKA
jgi:hypothetical protein